MATSSTSSSPPASPQICDVGGSGWFLPFTENTETEKPDMVPGLIYLVVMVYFFMGVAIVADTFVSSIEAITSRRRKVRLSDGRVVTQKVWNETVATLSLMALGSSAPEIFINVMDIFKTKFHFGSLGPAVIVGSGAFNLFVIIAVCMVSIPSAEERKIDCLPSFYITAIFSVVAYLWMDIILVYISPDVVEIWESVVTLLMFAALLFVSYKVDVGDWDDCLRMVHWLPPKEEEAPPNGLVKFESETLTVKASEQEQRISIKVRAEFMAMTSSSATMEPAKSGTRFHEEQEATCRYCCVEMSALAGVDYEDDTGLLQFTESAPEQTIELTINGKPAGTRASDEFLVVLQECEYLSFDPDDDGGASSAILSVTIQSDAEPWLDKVVNLDSMRRANADWSDMAQNAIYCNGSPEDQQDASAQDWVMHIMALPWKLLYLLIPPPSYFGGWACFWSSLFFIALNSMWLSDIAAMFGCVLDMPDIVTAVTLVALGTSMPDLFASLTAAVDDPIADASIINVTGSNGVNVFLGCGVPWTMASIYWQVHGRDAEWEALYPHIANKIDNAAFVVDAGSLGFAVFSYVGLALCALGLLVLKRSWTAAELGGPVFEKKMVGFTFIVYWLTWVGTTSWRTLRAEVMDVTEELLVLGSAFGVAGLLTCASVYKLRTFYREDLLEQERAGNRRVSFGSAADGGVGGRKSVGIKERGAARSFRRAVMATGDLSEPGGDGTPKKQGGTNNFGRRELARTRTGLGGLSSASLGILCSSGTRDLGALSGTLSVKDCNGASGSKIFSDEAPAIVTAVSPQEEKNDFAAAEPEELTTAEPTAIGLEVMAVENTMSEEGTHEPLPCPPAVSDYLSAGSHLCMKQSSCTGE